MLDWSLFFSGLLSTLFNGFSLISGLIKLDWIESEWLAFLGIQSNLTEVLIAFSLPIFSVANKHLNNLKKTSFYKGVYKGYTIELLPNSIKIIYYSTFNKIFRILGGISTILVVSSTHLYLQFLYIDYIIMLVSVLFLIQVFIINIIKLIYGIYLFIYKKEIFQVKNSPINILATKWSIATMCFKYGICAPLGALGTVTTLGVVSDQIHVAAGGQAHFVPWVAKHWKEVYKDIYGVYPSTELVTKINTDFGQPQSPTSQIPSIFTEEDTKEFESLTSEQRIIFRSEVQETYKKVKQIKDLPKND